MTCEVQDGTAMMPDGSPVSYDGLPSVKFQCKFDKIPNTIFFLQGWTVPGISIPSIDRPTPMLDLNEIGEKVDYQPFTIEFLVDAKMKNFKEIFAWMKRITSNPNQRDEVSDAMVIVNGTETIRFVDCWPISIGALEFKTNAEDMEYLTCTVQINYDWYEFL
jgi:hypothetical protein